MELSTLAADTPLENPAADLLGREPFARRLARELCASKNTKGLVVALNGDPGSGKTTCKNFVRHFATEVVADASLSAAVVEFNPWKLPTPGPVAAALQSEIAVQLGAESLRKHTGTLAEILSAADNSAPARQNLREQLAALPFPVVVFIDDVDRLPAPQIRQLFQLVKANADLPNLIHVLFYHRPAIVAALGEESPGAGGDVLRKVVQLELDLPEAPDQLLRKLLETELERILAQAEFPARPRDRWNDVFGEAVWPFFSTARDVKRFVSGLGFYFAAHFHPTLRVLEVNPIDLVLLEIVRMFAHPAYSEMRETFRRRGPRPARTLMGNDEERAEARFDPDRVASQSGLSPRMQRSLLCALRHLLPQGVGHGLAEDCDRDLRLCSPRHYDRYFHLGAVPVAVPAHRLVEIVRSADDREKMSSLLLQANTDGVLPEIIERIPRLLQGLSILQCASVARALCGVCDHIPAYAPADLEARLIKIAADLFGQLKSAVQRETVLSDMLEDTQRLTGPILLLHELRPRSDGSLAPCGTPLSIEQFRRIVKPAVERLHASAHAGEIWRSRVYGELIRRWWEWSDVKDDVRQWLASAVKQPENARAWLRTFVNANTSTQGKEFFLDIDEMSPFCDITLIAAPAAQASGDIIDQAAAKKLQAAVAQKGTTPPGGRRLALITVDPEGNVIR